MNSYRASLVHATVENNPDGDNHLHSLLHSEDRDRPCGPCIYTTLRYREFNGVSEEGVHCRSFPRARLCTVNLNTHLQQRKYGWLVMV